MSYQYRNSHYKDNTVWRPSYLYNGNHIPGKTEFIFRRVLLLDYHGWTCQWRCSGDKFIWTFCYALHYKCILLEQILASNENCLVQPWSKDKHANNVIVREFSVFPVSGKKCGGPSTPNQTSMGNIRSDAIDCIWNMQCFIQSPRGVWSGRVQLLCLQYIPRNMHTVFALLCFVVVIHWLIFPYPSGLLHWHCGNLTIAPMPAKQPWWIWINTSCEFIMNNCVTTTKQSTTKPCAYFLGYTVVCSVLSVWVVTQAYTALSLSWTMDERQRHSWHWLRQLLPPLLHHGDVVMSAMASQITSVLIVYLPACSDADQRRHQSSASLAFVRGIHRWPVNSPHKGSVTRKLFPFDDVIMHIWAHFVNMDWL